MVGEVLIASDVMAPESRTRPLGSFCLKAHAGSNGHGQTFPPKSRLYRSWMEQVRMRLTVLPLSLPCFSNFFLTDACQLAKVFPSLLFCSLQHQRRENHWENILRFLSEEVSVLNASAECISPLTCQQVLKSSVEIIDSVPPGDHYIPCAHL